MSHLSAVFAKAARLAAKTQQCYYIIQEAGKYEYATEEELDTFYLGSSPVAMVTPDGEWE